jgi:hypothetical protein
MWQKLKALLADERVFVSALLILVGLSSFALGRYSVGEEWGSQSQIHGEMAGAAAVSVSHIEGAEAESALTRQSEKPATAAPPKTPATTATAGPYVASKSGTKYHHETCGGAKQIKDSNRLYFATEATARAAGYTPAANCKILNQ